MNIPNITRSIDTTCEILIEVKGINKLSVLRPSMKALKIPYNMQYVASTCPSNLLFLNNLHKINPIKRHPALSYKNVGCA